MASMYTTKVEVSKDSSHKIFEQNKYGTAKDCRHNKYQDSLNNKIHLIDLITIELLSFLIGLLGFGSTFRRIIKYLEQCVMYTVPLMSLMKTIRNFCVYF